MNDYLIVLIGAKIGGMARHDVNIAAMKTGIAFPWGTLTMNMSGSFLMGLLYLLLGSVALSIAASA
jgi:CrcB protein